MGRITARARVLIDEILEQNQPIPNDLATKRTTGLRDGTEVYNINTKISGTQHTLFIIQIKDRSATLSADNRHSIPGYLELLNAKPKPAKVAARNNVGRYSSQWEKLIKGVVGRTKLSIISHEMGNKSEVALVKGIYLTLQDRFDKPRRMKITFAETRAEQKGMNRLMSDQERLDTIILLWPPEKLVANVAEDLTSQLQNRYNCWPRPKW